MSNTCVIVLKLTEDITYDPTIDYIGVDKGALFLANKKIHMKLALGDFDSIESNDLSPIKEYCDEIEVLNPIKDDSDSERAVKRAIALGYKKIIMVGGLGSRVDHEIVNLKLCTKYPNVVILQNENNRIISLKEGTYSINHTYQYASIFACVDSIVSWIDMKYPLDHKELVPSDLFGISNEVLQDTGTLIVHKGQVLLLQTSDKKKVSN